MRKFLNNINDFWFKLVNTLHDIFIKELGGEIKAILFPIQFKEARKYFLVAKNGKKLLLAKAFRDGLTGDKLLNKLNITSDEFLQQIKRIHEIEKLMNPNKSPYSTFKKEISRYRNRDIILVAKITLIFVFVFTFFAGIGNGIR